MNDPTMIEKVFRVEGVGSVNSAINHKIKKKKSFLKNVESFDMNGQNHSLSELLFKKGVI